jgi:hypothetical protein
MYSIVSILLLMLITADFSHASISAQKISFPGCPTGSQKTYIPDVTKPLWIVCRDKALLYQGKMLQLSIQGEILRIASMKNSQRNGKEIRFGASGFLEERSYLNGHLSQDSYIYKSDQILGRFMPKTMTEKDWQSLDDIHAPSLLGEWLKQEPYSIIHFENGRMTRIRFEKKDYQFEISPEGRIFSKNHPEMKNMFFIDTQPMWNLSSDDIRRVLLPGFGSCKKYSGPISRFGRHYDHLLYVRQSSEAKHLANLEEIRTRFIKFCVPSDLMEHLGVVECPPQLPQMLASKPCLVPVSDQLKIPYQPKYLKFDLSGGKSPEEFLELFGKDKIMSFIGDSDRSFISLFIPPKTMIIVKKAQKLLKYRVLPEHTATNKVTGKDLEDKDWWEWHPFPGSE